MKRTWWWRCRRWWHMKWRGLDDAAAEDLMVGLDLGDRKIVKPGARSPSRRKKAE